MPLASWGGLGDAAWPVLIGLAVLAMIRRQRPARPLTRVGVVYAALLLYAVATSPRDPITNTVSPNPALSLLVALGAGLGFLLVAFRWE